MPSYWMSYRAEELVCGAEVTVPWKTKGKVSHWKAIFIDPSVQTEQPGKFPMNQI